MTLLLGLLFVGGMDAIGACGATWAGSPTLDTNRSLTGTVTRKPTATTASEITATVIPWPVSRGWRFA